MHLHGAPQSVGAGFRQADVADLAFLDQLRHGANRFLDRSIRIDAVLVVEVDVLDAQPLQTCFAALLT